MIGSNLPPLPYLDGLRKSLESGKVTAGRIEVASATADVQAQIDKSFRESERDLEQLKARFKFDPDSATYDAKGNSIELPDVQSISKSDASPVPENLQPQIKIGRPNEKAINADSGALSITSAAVYQEWLLARGSVDVSV
ncbi:hypothetical protein PS918_02130 [Pseudomonas fluorescens]|uniref:Uncharacterized protein n=1 Tax=Pseudomonas fluorescens TaxID=294 RepID=A0A5E7S820_PSEFL|nr:hypothetical protein [Pseudomonas fluorescens]VVP79283.1 hypothetical protein PS918_02130 [Pseudomonas fluorescens]